MKNKACAAINPVGVFSGGVLGVGVLWLGVAWAGDAVMMGRNPSPCEISLALGIAKPDCPPLPPLATESAPPVAPPPPPLAVSPLPAPPPKIAAAPPVSAPVASPASASAERKAAFRITFALGSAHLTAEAQPVLDRIGAVMTTPGAEANRYRIVGHTDGIGGKSRNRRLSWERAAAVKAYLVAHFKIAPARLEVLGHGADDPIDRAHPAAPENRRVEFTNLGR